MRRRIHVSYGEANQSAAGEIDKPFKQKRPTIHVKET
jgi:hypothetical protein